MIYTIACYSPGVPRKGWRVVTIREEVYEELYRLYEKETAALKFKPKFTGWLNEHLAEGE
jgi:hypothetical protein